ncbi:hypothetical protein [Columbia Basin potato purple top phytoplasma]|uniref:AAA family ATPase n=1 Tax=Columbia Basin potato purple top phytoplasma TaxID=307134 RepID=A0ABT5L8F5_9MOLU|nr:hypothetical protein [Columbia Basin potato purple top phytoplasma]MDC9031945.1 AAA family ATPase [Columbia Basin potato purple top phytoplasma]
MKSIGDHNKSLYHRITFQKQIWPFGYKESSLFFNHLTYIDKIQFYSVFS